MALTKQEASAEISKKIKEAQAIITECEKIADETGVDFSWDGPAYGMGGYYTGKPSPDDADQDWDESDAGWSASSQNC